MTKYLESESLELKEKYNDSIAREIVSFLNADGGTILIGVRDDGAVVGVDKIDETLRRISDVITTHIEPNPQDEIVSELRFDEGKTIIALKIGKGSKNIYCQKKHGYSSAGCTVRIGTTCREMTPEQIKLRYEKNFFDTEYMLRKKAGYFDLSFRELKIYYTEKGYHVDDKSFAANLNLKTADGQYNLLAELLSDKNNIPLIFVKFQGRDKASISERSDYGHGCLITSYEKIKNRLHSENICVTDTTIRPRKDTYLFDFDSVNEAVINALVHNDWTITEPQISMFRDRLEILSHGGLPNGMSKKDFFDGISKPRNVTLMRIFLTMGLCEHTGHGIPTIISRYGKEVFEIEDSYIRCTIPFDAEVLSDMDDGNVGLNVGMNGENVGMNVGLNNKNVGLNVGLNKTERNVIRLLTEDPHRSAEELAGEIGVTPRTVERAFANLQKKGFLERKGSKRDGFWLVLKGANE